MNADFRRILRKHGGRPWATRRNLAVWRGATTGGEFRRGTWRGFLRSRLVLLSRRRPDLLDAGFHWIDAQADAETVAEMRAADMERRKLTYDEQAAFKVTPPTHTPVTTGHAKVAQRLISSIKRIETHMPVVHR